MLRLLFAWYLIMIKTDRMALPLHSIRSKIRLMTYLLYIHALYFYVPLPAKLFFQLSLD